VNVSYLMDPLCGWCYGAWPGLQRLRAAPGVQLSIAPTGLFAGDGARPLDASFAAYAWANDQRIERLTGQRFSERYREQVLNDHGKRFDSAAGTMALTAVQTTAPEREFDALRAIQEARYLDGRDTCDLVVVADVLRGLGLEAAAQRLRAVDDALMVANQDRVARARRDMQVFGAQGVPNLVVTDDRGRRLVRGAVLYGEPEALMDQVLAASADNWPRPAP